MVAGLAVSATTTTTDSSNVPSKGLTDKDTDPKTFSLSSYGAKLTNAYEDLLGSYAAGNDIRSKINDLISQHTNFREPVIESMSTLDDIHLNRPENWAVLSTDLPQVSEKVDDITESLQNRWRGIFKRIPYRLKSARADMSSQFEAAVSTVEEICPVSLDLVESLPAPDCPLK
jgi:hypothetical protein